MDVVNAGLTSRVGAVGRGLETMGTATLNAPTVIEATSAVNMKLITHSHLETDFGRSELGTALGSPTVCLSMQWFVLVLDAVERNMSE